MKTVLVLAVALLATIVVAPLATADPDPVSAATGSCITLSPGHVPPAWVDPEYCVALVP